MTFLVAWVRDQPLDQRACRLGVGRGALQRHLFGPGEVVCDRCVGRAWSCSHHSADGGARSWTARTAVVWVVGAVLVGGFSPFTLLAALVGGVVVLAHPGTTSAIESSASVAAFVYAVLTVAVRRTYDVHSLQQWWQRTYDGFVVSHSGPFGLVSQSFADLRRVAVVFSGGPSWWATLVLVASVGDATSRRSVTRPASAWTIRAQYLVLLLLVAFLGGLTKVLPFGPTRDGMRLSTVVGTDLRDRCRESIDPTS